MLALLKRLFAGAPPIEKAEDLRPGKAVLIGTLAAGAEQIRSVQKNLTCVAYYYRAAYKAQARGKTVDRTVKEAEVYASEFFLAVGGEKVRVEPPRKPPFDAAEHRALQSRGFPGFTVFEQVLRPGTVVKLVGRLLRRDDEWRVKLDRIELLTEEEQAARAEKRPPAHRRRRR